MGHVRDCPDCSVGVTVVRLHCLLVVSELKVTTSYVETGMVDCSTTTTMIESGGEDSTILKA